VSAAGRELHLAPFEYELLVPVMRHRDGGARVPPHGLATRRTMLNGVTLALARPPRVDAIVCEDLSRVTRDLADGAALFKRLQFAGVPLIGIADNIDTANPSSKMS
jgi:Resolvase, N terminal domain